MIYPTGRVPRRAADPQPLEPNHSQTTLIRFRAASEHRSLVMCKIHSCLVAYVQAP